MDLDGGVERVGGGDYGAEGECGDEGKEDGVGWEKQNDLPLAHVVADGKSGRDGVDGMP